MSIEGLQALELMNSRYRALSSLIAAPVDDALAGVISKFREVKQQKHLCETPSDGGNPATRCADVQHVQ